MSVHQHDPWTDILEKHARRGRRKVVRRVLQVGAVVLAAGLCVGILLGLPLLNRLRDGNGEPVALPTALSSNSPAPDSPSASRDPFADTPAAAFAVGADGIVLPPAADAGSFSAAEVEAALQRTKKLMTVAFLDPRVFGGDLEPVYSAMPSHDRRFVQEFAADPSKQKDLLYYAMRLAPGVTQVVPEIRVKGTVSYALGTEPRTLKIATNHVYVYPLRRDGFEALVTVHRDREYTFYKTGMVRSGDEGPYSTGGRGFLYWDFDCESMKKGLLAPGRLYDLSPSEPGEPRYSERFDPTSPIAGRDIC